MVHVDNKVIFDGLLRGERKCIDPKAGDADLWINNWEALQLLNVERNIGGSGVCQSAPHRKGQERGVAV